MNDIGRRLKELRKVHLGNMSQEELGKILDITGASISRIEKGERNATERMIKTLCQKCRVDYFWLTEGIGEPFIDYPETKLDEIIEEYDLDEMDKKIIEEYLKLKPEERAAIKKYIKNLTE